MTTPQATHKRQPYRIEAERPTAKRRRQCCTCAEELELEKAKNARLKQAQEEDAKLTRELLHGLSTSIEALTENLSKTYSSKTHETKEKQHKSNAMEVPEAAPLSAQALLARGKSSDEPH